LITKFAGKRKLSQNQPLINQTIAVKGLKSIGSPDSIEIATLVSKASQNVD